MLELRRNAQSIIDDVQRGQRLVLTYRGKPMARIEPLETLPGDTDAFYDLADLADADGESLTNSEMDRAIYDSVDLLPLSPVTPLPVVHVKRSARNGLGSDPPRDGYFNKIIN